MKISTDHYLPEDIVAYFPDHYTAEYWDRVANGALAFQQCSNCQAFRHWPGPMCPKCESMDYNWHTVRGRGSVYSYTVVTHPVHPALADTVPYNIVLVEFEDAPGVRLVTNCIDATEEDLIAGMPVEVVYQRYADVTLPRVRKV